MKIKPYLVIMFLILSVVTYAQNQFIYVRYNPKDGNVSAIIRTIDNLIQKSTGETIVFLSQASTPIVATSYSEWEEIRVVLLSMQTAFEYYPEDEALKLNQYYTDLFSEIIDENLHLKGANDESWVCTFIISEVMLNSHEFEALAENIAINELARRMSVDILTYNDTQYLSIAELESNTMFKFNLSE